MNKPNGITIGLGAVFLAGVGVATVAYKTAPQNSELPAQEVPVCYWSDLDRDGMVGALDQAILLSHWGTPNADLDLDGTTGSSDLAILTGCWGSAPEVEPISITETQQIREPGRYRLLWRWEGDPSGTMLNVKAPGAVLEFCRFDVGASLVGANKARAVEVDGPDVEFRSSSIVGFDQAVKLDRADRFAGLDLETRTIRYAFPIRGGEGILLRDCDLQNVKGLILRAGLGDPVIDLTVHRCRFESLSSGSLFRVGTCGRPPGHPEGEASGFYVLDSWFVGPPDVASFVIGHDGNYASGTVQGCSFVDVQVFARSRASNFLIGHEGDPCEFLLSKPTPAFTLNGTGDHEGKPQEVRNGRIFVRAKYANGQEPDQIINLDHPEVEAINVEGEANGEPVPDEEEGA